jgi:hypothetical protein
MNSHENTSASLPAGLATASDGYRLELETTTLTTSGPQAFRFRVVGPDARPVTSYKTEHAKELHFILVRRDLADYQHLHPSRNADGIWSVPITLSTAGSYKAFADFSPADSDKAVILAVDLQAAGSYQPQALPPVSTVATVDGYTVRLTGKLTPGAAADITTTVTKDGMVVTDLDPYLGAYGHLVALRVGDLAYLHVHPEGSPGDDHTPAGPAISFHAEVPTSGTYRLFLDFSHAGRVHTAEFTAVATAAS